jgi:RNA polymerase sigma-70 factor (ECF subfamily)
MWILCAVLRLAGSAAADQDALSRMASGDHSGLEELYDRHARLIYSLALRILRDQGDAEDIVQEVFSQAWRQAGRYSASRGSVVAWLVTVARSRAIDRVRGRRSQPVAAGDDLAALDRPDPAAPQLDEALDWAGRAAEVRGALDTLPTLQRLVIDLAFFDGLTHVEIANKLELPLGTVKTRIRQGLLTLRDRLAASLSGAERKTS